MLHHLRPQMVRHIRQFRGRHKQFNPRVVMQDGKAMRHRVARNVLPANVQQPVVAVGKGNQRRLLPRRPQVRRQTMPLGVMALPGKTFRMHGHLAHRGGGLLGPKPIHHVLSAPQLNARAVQGFHQQIHLPRRMQHRIKTNYTALRQLVLQPIGQRHLGPCHGRKDIRHLRLDLRAIAPVDKDPRNTLQCCTKPGRARKSCEPRQPIIARGNIFSLMRIGARHQKPVQSRAQQFCTQRRQPRRPLLRARGDLETLEHTPLLHPFFKYRPTVQLTRRMPMTRARLRGSLSKSAASCSVIAPAN